MTSAEQSPAVEARDLRKRYGQVVALDGLDLVVRRGECFGMLGPNGAGKTTAIEILQGINLPDSGDVRILGLEWQSRELELRQRLGSQLQETRFPEKITVRETISLFASFYRNSRSVEDVLEMVQLREKRKAYVRDLSGGQHQRLAVACALVGTPELLFLDEPTTGLDPQSRRQLWDVISNYRADGGTVLITTHYMEEAQQLCDRVAVVDRGRIIALGTPRDLIRSLGAEHVVEFALGRGTVSVELLAALPGVEHVGFEDGQVRLRVARVHESVPALLELLRERRAELVELATHTASLEDVFISLTGRHLRDD